MDELLEALTRASSASSVRAPRTRVVAAALAIVGLVLAVATGSKALRHGAERPSPEQARDAVPPMAAPVATPEVPAVEPEPIVDTIAVDGVPSAKRRAPASPERKSRGAAARPARERYHDGLKDPF
jgi:hypothetical protein